MPASIDTAAPAAAIAAVYRDAQHWFTAQATRDPTYLAALAKRRLTGSQARAAEIGWAPAEDAALTDHLVRRGHRLNVLRAAGVSVRRGPRHGDVFRGRVTFAYRQDGQVVGFTARTVTGAAAKWINTSGNAVFDKSRLLYGVHAIHERTESVAIVEGAWDAAAVTATTNGRIVGVAACGTGFTPHHADVVAGVGLPVIVATDADTAGRGAAVRIHRMLLDASVSGAGVLALPDGHDPSSWHADGHDLPAALDARRHDLTRWVLDQHHEQLHPRHGPAAQVSVLRLSIAPLLVGLPVDQRAAAVSHLTALTGLLPLTVYETLTAD